jgi:hypothetical protein
VCPEAGNGLRRHQNEPLEWRLPLIFTALNGLLPLDTQVCLPASLYAGLFRGSLEQDWHDPYAARLREEDE